jgi:hypothetical protein
MRSPLELDVVGAAHLVFIYKVSNDPTAAVRAIVDSVADVPITLALTHRSRMSGTFTRSGSNRAGAVPKYLNMSRTHTYDKSIALYRPSRPALDRHANVVVCEGPLDALAIAAQAATSGFTNRYAPVALCGVALTDNQLHRILAIHPLPPILTGDGDPPGRKAAVEWATRAALAGRESVVTIWPDGHDPASWIAEHGEHGLVALTRKGCLEPTNTDLRPHHAGEIIALTAVAEAVAGCIPLDRARYMALAPLNHLQGGAASRYLDAVGKACASAFDSDEILVACMRSPTVKNGTSVGGQPIAEAVEL